MEGNVLIVTGIIVCVIVALVALYDLLRTRHYLKHPPDNDGMSEVEDDGEDSGE